MNQIIKDYLRVRKAGPRIPPATCWKWACRKNAAKQWYIRRPGDFKVYQQLAM